MIKKTGYGHITGQIAWSVSARQRWAFLHPDRLIIIDGSDTDWRI